MQAWQEAFGDRGDKIQGELKRYIARTIFSATRWTFPDKLAPGCRKGAGREFRTLVRSDDGFGRVDGVRQLAWGASARVQKAGAG